MQKQSLLIVDDYPFIHKMIRAFLKPDAISAHSVFDANTVVNRAAELKPSLILLDVDMPDLDGFEVYRRLKANAATSQTPVIFLTADATMSDKIRGLEMGAVDYITKPVAPAELRARVRAALRSQQSIEQTALTDPVTQLWNDSYLQTQLDSQLSLSRRCGLPLACVMADVDNLNKINSTMGPAVGDDVLRNVAGILQAKARSEDLVSYGGEGKYTVLMMGTTMVEAADWAESARSQIEREPLEFDDKPVAVTCSFGVADSGVDGGDSLPRRADAALRRAKQCGGNMVSAVHAADVQRIAVA